MAIRLVAKGRNGPQLTEASKDILLGAYEETESILTSDRDIQVHLVPSSDPSISRYMDGASGWTRSGDTMDIYVDMKNPTWKPAMRRSFIHEFNHVIRAQRFKRLLEDYTLMDTITFEGLAQCFEKELCRTLPLYAKAISSGQARAAWLKLKPHLLQVDNDLWKRAFFSVNDSEFPHWSGYTLSYLIVRRLMSSSNLNWRNIMSMESQAIVGSGLG